MSRELIKCVDILFAPYNYLIDRAYKDSLGIEWNSSILIFDEAHNLVSRKIQKCRYFISLLVKFLYFSVLFSM